MENYFDKIGGVNLNANTVNWTYGEYIDCD